MIEQKNSNSNSQLLTTKKSPSNTLLFLHLPLSFTTNSFDRLLSTSNKAKIELFLLNIHLDYLRISTTDLTKNSFGNLLSNLGLPIPYQENRISWHPDKSMPKSKKYQNSIQSDRGIKLGYTKRLKDRSIKPKYVYDIMIDFSGSYFADLSLLEQQELIYYLNSNWKLKCHRIDVAMDDYSRKMFPVDQMIIAFLEGNNFGFKDIDDNYIDIIDNKLIGTLGIGSRCSSFFIRIYTKHRYFVRWETELKQKKARELFDKLASLTTDKTTNSLPLKAIYKALVDAAINQIDFRDKSSVSNPKNATKERTKRLPFWQELISKLNSLIESLTDSNYTRNS